MELVQNKIDFLHIVLTYDHPLNNVHMHEVFVTLQLTKRIINMASLVTLLPHIYSIFSNFARAIILPNYIVAASVTGDLNPNRYLCFFCTMQIMGAHFLMLFKVLNTYSNQ